MNARKLPSGSWRARLFLGEDENGKKHYKSFTASTKREAERLALNYAEEQKSSTSATFGDAFDEYMEIKSNILSPSTINGYKKMKKYYIDFLNMDVTAITQPLVDRFVNTFASDHSPKTVRNAYSLFCCVMQLKIPSCTFNAKMPQKNVLQYYIPTDDEMKTLLAYAKTTNYDLYVAILLASIGTLRRSEVCGLDAADITGCIVHVHNVVVHGRDGGWVLKTVPKNSSSDRYIEYPKAVIKELRKERKICQLTPDTLTEYFGRAINNCRLPHFRFHDLRHYAATIMHAMGVPEAYIMERGGWKTNTVLNQVYRGTRSDFSKKYAGETNNYFDQHLL